MTRLLLTGMIVVVLTGTAAGAFHPGENTASEHEVTWLGFCPQGLQNMALITTAGAMLWVAALRYQVQRKTRQIQQQRDELEDRVAQRTRELETTNARLQTEAASRKDSETHRQHSEELLSNTLKALKDLVLVIDRDFRVVLSNWAGFEHIPEEVRTAHPCCYESLAGQSEACPNCLAHKAFEQGTIQTGTHTNLRTGQILDVCVVPMKDAAGEVELVVEHVRDITEQKQLETQLTEQSRAFRNLINNTDLGFVVIDEEGQVLQANEPYARMAGASDPKYILGRNFFEWVAPEAMARAHYSVVECREAGRVIDYDTIYLRPDGTRVNVQVNATHEIRKGKPLYVGICKDITQGKWFEQERSRIISELETRNAEMERFTYTVSHDLKSPLITIKGFLGKLRSDFESQRFGRVEHRIDRIENAARHMTELLDDLLELSRVGRLVNPEESIPLEELVDEVLELLDGPLQESGVTVTTEGEFGSVTGDRVRLREVLQNLIENAIKFRGEQPHPAITITGQITEELAVVSVQDNGIGIPSEYHKKIFGLFDQLDPRIPGTGVGLALVKRIVEYHRGQVEVSSAGPDRGTTFTIRLPAESRKGAIHDQTHTTALG